PWVVSDRKPLKRVVTFLRRMEMVNPEPVTMVTVGQPVASAQSVAPAPHWQHFASPHFTIRFLHDSPAEKNVAHLAARLEALVAAVMELLEIPALPDQQILVSLTDTPSRDDDQTGSANG